ncbi:hypothetical protein [Curtobacterium flaccumfaciens]|jgi:hypothetical protein|nr:hypothetical protein [Curtobacterium flaccumfaciens]MCS0644071.1 hypothetical protein [Curtobacterium flaccumfaciens pv. flaccumfaciens]MCS5507652.1 hypothetical protein [Curtobacterium flaccumfaciens pv. flaccumfaciens]MCS6527749.1 hypothetical protein [Curtobacterium flaccumfaciens pv. flaccumfaciens]MCS6531357.1 hypothetical protein [Curtobacterium flaccumfaciens pv. flaccumfaciens]MCS6576273.1 hypothetical protein [Curtobacterium flaccumfaciens pv. flaccumfaciens]
MLLTGGEGLRELLASDGLRWCPESGQHSLEEQRAGPIRSGLHRRFEAELVSVVSPATASPYCAQIVLGALIAAGLDNVTNVPAVIRNGRGDILATNELGRALFSEMYVQPARPVNHARFIFLDHRSHRFYPEWDNTAADMVAMLRDEAGRNPYDRAVSGLVGELSTRSDEFRILWAAQNVVRPAQHLRRGSSASR